MSENYAINVEHLFKVYKLYNSPFDRLKESLNPLRYHYHHEFKALNDVNFQVEKGETFGIIGKNGSGKSTLLKIITGVLTPTSGSVKVNGKISALLELGTGFNPEMTGIENVYFNGMLMGYTRQEMDEHLDEILSFADIGEFVHQPVKTYSSGMFVRLAFAVAINVKPDILIIDEALSVGDIFFQQKCYKRIDELRRRGITILLVTHSMADIMQYCSRALVLNDGQLIICGNSSDAVKQYFLAMQQSQTDAFLKRSGTYKSLSSEYYRTTENDMLPVAEAFYDFSNASVVTNGWSRCTGVALCNFEYEPRRVLRQGETARFYYEFELLENIDVPIGGLMLINDKNIIVHGNSTLEYGTDCPYPIKKGERLRFWQEITLDVAPGEYTFNVGLATISREDYEHREMLLYSDLISKTVRLCHVTCAGHFTVVSDVEGRPVQFRHHGMCNLKGCCNLSVFDAEV